MERAAKRGRLARIRGRRGGRRERRKPTSGTDTRGNPTTTVDEDVKHFLMELVGVGGLPSFPPRRSRSSSCVRGGRGRGGGGRDDDAPPRQRRCVQTAQPEWQLFPLLLPCLGGGGIKHPHLQTLDPNPIPLCRIEFATERMEEGMKGGVGGRREGEEGGGEVVGGGDWRGILSE